MLPGQEQRRWTQHVREQVSTVIATFGNGLRTTEIDVNDVTVMQVSGGVDKVVGFGTTQLSDEGSIVGVCLVFKGAVGWCRSKYPGMQHWCGGKRHVVPTAKESKREFGLVDHGCRQERREKIGVEGFEERGRHVGKSTVQVTIPCIDG